jgi:uncharacterized protein YbbK (DUF523 family)
MHHILVSACLLGQPVRYDGRSVPNDGAVLATWKAENRVIAVCPEVAGGLPIPRPAAEIEPNATAATVLDGKARIVTRSGDDVTLPFIHGAQAALTVARQFDIRMAVLKEGSPSCGSHYVYDGHFSSQRQPGSGVTAQLLRQAGIQVFSEHQWDEALAYLNQLERNA